MRYTIMAIVIFMIGVLFVIAASYSKSNADTKIIVNYSDKYAGTEPYILNWRIR